MIRRHQKSQRPARTGECLRTKSSRAVPFILSSSGGSMRLHTNLATHSSRKKVACVRIEETCESCKKSGLACDARSRARDSGRRAKGSDGLQSSSPSSSSSTGRPSATAQGRRDYPPSSPLNTQSFGLEVSRRHASPVEINESLLTACYFRMLVFPCTLHFHDYYNTGIIILSTRTKIECR